MANLNITSKSNLASRTDITNAIDDQIALNQGLYVPMWKPQTNYASGQYVLNPSGVIVSASMTHTSGATYNDTNWNTIQANVGSPQIIQSNTRTSSYTLAPSDAGKIVEVDSTSNTTITIPASSSAAFPVGAIIDLYAVNTGQVNVVPSSGVTLNTMNGTAIKGQYANARLRQRSLDNWVLTGNTTLFADLTTISGLMYRMRASTIGMTTNNTPVSSAAFEVGNITLTNSIANQQPLWFASGSNSKPYINFNGTSNYLALTSGMPSSSQPLTFAFVMNLRDTTSGQQVFNAGGTELLLNQSGSSSISAYAGSLISGTVAFPGTALVTAIFDPSTSKTQIYLNGTSVVNAAAGGGGINDRLWIGTHPSTARFLNADLYEILIFSRALNNADLNTLRIYSQSTYGTA